MKENWFSILEYLDHSSSIVADKGLNVFTIRHFLLSAKKQSSDQFGIYKNTKNANQSMCCLLYISNNIIINKAKTILFQGVKKNIILEIYIIKHWKECDRYSRSRITFYQFDFIILKRHQSENHSWQNGWKLALFKPEIWIQFKMKHFGSPIKQ